MSQRPVLKDQLAAYHCLSVLLGSQFLLLFLHIDHYLWLSGSLYISHAVALFAVKPCFFITYFSVSHSFLSLCFFILTPLSFFHCSHFSCLVLFVTVLLSLWFCFLSNWVTLTCAMQVQYLHTHTQTHTHSLSSSQERGIQNFFSLYSRTEKLKDPHYWPNSKSVMAIRM